RVAIVMMLVGLLQPAAAVASIRREGPRAPVPGTPLWGSVYNGGAGTRAVGVSPDGTKVFVTSDGGKFPPVAYQAWTGRLLWTSHGATSLASPDALAVSPDGSKVFVTGFSELHMDDYATVAFDASTGVELWDSRYDDSAQQDFA